MVDYMNAIKKPYQDIVTLVIGSVIGLIPLVNIFILGYAAHVAKATMAKQPAMPKWNVNNIVDYIVKAILIIVIEVIYLIPALIVLFIGGTTIFASIMGAVAQGGQVDMMALLLPAMAAGGIFVLLGVLLAIIGGVFAVMGIMYFLKEGNVGAAFNIGGILKKVLTLPFWLTVVVLFVYGFILQFIIGLLMVIPVIGVALAIIATGPLAFIMASTGYTMFAQVFMETP